MKIDKNQSDVRLFIRESWRTQTGDRTTLPALDLDDDIILLLIIWTLKGYTHSPVKKYNNWCILNMFLKLKNVCQLKCKIITCNKKYWFWNRQLTFYCFVALYYTKFRILKSPQCFTREFHRRNMIWFTIFPWIKQA